MTQMTLSRFAQKALLPVGLLLVAFGCAVDQAPPPAQDALPSWNDGAAKTAILGFVAAVTEEGGKDYVEPAERIAVFDHDGTLWVEYPLYLSLIHI